MNRREARDTDETAESGRSGPPLKLIALLLLVVGIAVFFFQNTDDAPISFLWIDGDWPIWLVIGISFVAGALVDRLGGWLWSRSRRRE